MVARILTVVLALYVTVQLVKGQQVGFGACPSLTGKPDFNLTAFQGEWYEHSKYRNRLQFGSKCSKLEFSNLGEDDTVNITRTRYYGNRGTNLTSVACFVTSPTVGEITFKYAIFGPVGVKVKLTILDTDYDEFAIFWSCRQIGLIKLQFLWVFRRSLAGLSDDAGLQVTSVLEEHGLSPSKLIASTQDCYSA